MWTSTVNHKRVPQTKMSKSRVLLMPDEGSAASTLWVSLRPFPLFSDDWLIDCWAIARTELLAATSLHASRAGLVFWRMFADALWKSFQKLAKAQRVKFTGSINQLNSCWSFHSIKSRESHKTSIWLPQNVMALRWGGLLLWMWLKSTKN